MEEINEKDEMQDNTADKQEDKNTEVEKINELLRQKLSEKREKLRESDEAIREGKGVLKLETPIRAASEDIEELIYDFTDLTGMEYIDAMDTDPNAANAFKITNRQALALFAKAAAKKTDKVDMRDIIEQIGATDAVEGVQLAMLFFRASSTAGRMRISKM